MTNRLAVLLLLLVLALAGADLALTGGAGVLFLLRKFADLIEWIAFWR